MDVLPFLAAVRARLRRAVALEGAARLSGTVIGLTLAAMLADLAWFLPGWLRLGLLLGILLAGSLIAWRRLFVPLRRTLADRDVAAFAERRLPNLGGRLTTAVEGISLGEAEAAILAAHLTPAAVSVLVPARKLPSRLLGSGLALLAAGLGFAFWPQEATDGLRRLALPFSAADWTRRARLEGNVIKPVVASDDKVVLDITRSHPRPDFTAPVEVAWRNAADGTGDRRQLPGLVGPRWSHGLALPIGIWTVTVTSADAHPLTLHARVVERPHLAAVAVAMTPPSYTQQPTTTLATLATSVLAGSRIVVRATFSGESARPAAAATITLPGTAAPVSLQADGAEWMATFTAGTSGDIVLSASDADGIASAPAARFPFAVEPDRAPTAILDGPRRSEAVSAKARVALTIHGSDDLGLADLALLGAVVPAGADLPPAGSGKELFTTDAVRGELRANREAFLDIGALATVGERVLLSARARDRNDLSGPGVGLSEPILLTVVAEDMLRQEFDRLLTEARDQVGRARDDMVEGLAKSERLPGASRAAAQAAVRARDLAAQVIRRWTQNNLPAEAIAPAQAATGLLDGTALPALARTPDEGADAGRQAERALAEAEKLLGSLLADGDLTRLLAALILREEALFEESRGFVRAFLTKPLDAAARALQGNLSTRQRDLADQLGELERRILGTPGGTLAKAQEVVRAQSPAERLRTAATDLAGNAQRPKAVAAQTEALASMRRLLELLRGSDAAGDLAERAGRLAAEQERLAADLEQGADPGSLQERQKDLAERTAVLAKEVEAKNPAAAKSATAANQAQKGAQGAMAKGDRAGSARQAEGAAALLREAQKQLAGDKPEPKDPQKKKPDAQDDLLTLLRALRTAQAAVVAEVSALHQRLGDGDLGFGAAREVAVVTKAQSDIALRLNEDGLKPVEKIPVAKAALQRVATALAASEAHLAKPAVGERGVRLATIGLNEITRLLSLVRDLPPGEGEGSGGECGGGQQPPFPPRAEIALLAAMQEEVAAMTAAGRPIDLAQAQAEIRTLVEAALAAARPDSRPQLLLERARRAMASAAWRLGQADRGLATRHEQTAAEQALRRLLAESGGGKGDGDNGKQPPTDNPQSGEQPPSGGGAASAAGGTPQSGTPAGKTITSTAVQINPDDGTWLNLPPAIRERMVQARDQGLSPAQLDVFKAYLQNLEDGR